MKCMTKNMSPEKNPSTVSFLYFFSQLFALHFYNLINLKPNYLLTWSKSDIKFINAQIFHELKLKGQVLKSQRQF